MSSYGPSLRSLVEKWLGAESAACPRVTRFSHAPRKRWRYVCVEATRPSGTFSFVFFRHDDGSWSVFPPNIQRLTMGFSKVDRGPDDVESVRTEELELTL